MREENINILNDTLNIMNKGHYTCGNKVVSLKLSISQMKEVCVLLPDDVSDIAGSRGFKHVPAAGQLGVSCVNTDSYTLARERAKYAGTFKNRVLVLNLANPVNPGGGVRRGAKAQEEDLCRKSSLLLSLESEKASAYYSYNKSLNTYMGSDAIMISPHVEIIRDEKNNLLPESVVVAVMTCAAPMVTYGIENVTDSQYQQMVYNRIMGMLKAAAYFGYQVLVLGAFGCGAFGNDAHVVSELFYKAMKEFYYDGMKLNDFFNRIDFAVMDHSANQYNYSEFSRRFNYFGGDKDIQKQAFTFFWLDNEKYGEFSNWYQRPFVIDDFKYFCVEQYMMAQKAKLFHDAENYTKILRANTPEGCKWLGKQVKPFDAAKWNAVKYETVKTGNRAKYMQNPDLKALLLSTGDSILAEASPKDAVWGIAMDAKTASNVAPFKWPGENLLGRILMELRKEFGGK